MPGRTRQNRGTCTAGLPVVVLYARSRVRREGLPNVSRSALPPSGLISAILATVQNELLRFLSCNRSHRTAV